MIQFDYAIQRTHRKTISLIVERDNSLLVRAPHKATDVEVNSFVNKKKLWLYTKLAEKEYMSGNFGRKEFVSGEGFLYLGKSYKLKLVASADVPLKLSNGYFELQKDLVSEGKKFFISWYRARALERVELLTRKYAKEYGFSYKGIKVQDIPYRRGSCTPTNTIIFNWKTILAPLSVVDYIVIHELVHTKEKRHSARFWDILRSILPNYEKQKDWLKRHGGGLKI